MDLLAGSTMAEDYGERMEDIMARQTLEIERMRDAFALLGVNPCACCKKFVRRSDAGAMFDAGELICYGCVREWWPQRSAQLSGKEHENLEGKLVFWLRDYHRAETFKDPAKLPETSLQELNIVANCLECHGTGKSLGEDSCRFCEGRGTVWVIVARKKA
jgi:hypothetical protein